MNGTCRKGVTVKLVLNLPSGAVKELKHHKTMSGKFTLTATSSTDLTKRTSASIPVIRGR